MPGPSSDAATAMANPRQVNNGAEWAPTADRQVKGPHFRETVQPSLEQVRLGTTEGYSLTIRADIHQV